jgi:tRNA (cytidine/uridine-2'-O-)-methyltransferase
MGVLFFYLSDGALMISVGLYEPEIPPNTGNIARLCAAVGARLHIVGRPAFRMDDKAVKRAGLDYWPHVDIVRHGNMEAFRGSLLQGTRIVCFTTKSELSYTRFQFGENDCLLFGPETRGLPREILSQEPDLCVTIPMPSGNVRSLNLANSVSIGLFEAMRQVGLV